MVALNKPINLFTWPWWTGNKAFSFLNENLKKFLHPVCKKRSMIKYYLILSDQLSNQSTADQLRVGANRPEAKVRTHKLMMTLRILNRICTCLMFFGGAVSFDQAVSSPTQLFSSILFWCTSLAEIIFRCTLWVHSTKDKNRIESRTDIIFPI